jgi:hypothetical protein
MDNTERPGKIINRELYMITENEIQKTGSPSEGWKAHRDILRKQLRTARTHIWL